MSERFYIDQFDHDDGHKSFHVCDGGQTVTIVDESWFDNPNDARKWAYSIRDALLARDECAGEEQDIEWAAKDYAEHMAMRAKGK